MFNARIVSSVLSIFSIFVVASVSGVYSDDNVFFASYPSFALVLGGCLFVRWWCYKSKPSDLYGLPFFIGVVVAELTEMYFGEGFSITSIYFAILGYVVFLILENNKFFDFK